MAKRREILERWKFPYVQHGGVTLVARKDATTCVTRIFSDSCRFYGYDAFTLFLDNRLQPHLDWSPSWPGGPLPALQKVISELEAHPPEVTHYEFIFEDDI
jgi:hypothetical protein